MVEAEGMTSSSFLSAGGDEHLQHAFGHDVAADGVARGEKHTDDSDDAQESRIRRGQRNHGADQNDAVHEVRSGHERRMQDHRNAGNDLVAGECREHEYIKRYDAIDHYCASTALRVASCLIWPS